MIGRLHQCCKVTDANLLQRRLSAAGIGANVGQTLPQRVGPAQQDVVINLQLAKWRSVICLAGD